jgi:signal peptidase I
MLMLPEKVVEKLKTYKPYNMPLMSKERPDKGDLIVYREHLLYVYNVWEKHCNCYLVHSFPEYATKSDWVIDPEESGVPYPIVIQNGLCVNVFYSDIEKYIHNIKIPTNRTGIHGVCNFTDAINIFKSEQYEITRRLTERCTSILLEGD